MPVTWKGYEALTNGLASKQSKLRDLSPLGQRVAGLVVEGNREGLLAGVAADGTPMPTPKNTEERKGAGPYLVPEGAQSTLITTFRADVVPAGDGRVEIRGTWGVPHAKYHARYIAGIRPQTRDRIKDEVENYLRGL